jgi:hypothetical protein
MQLRKETAKEAAAEGNLRRGFPFFRGEEQIAWHERWRKRGMAPKSTRSITSWQMILFIFLSLLLMAWLDYVTGQELVFSCAYLVPVCLTAWWFSRRWMIAISVLSGITAFVVDELDGYEYSNAAIGYWNAFTCLLISLAIGYVLSRLRQTLIDRQKAHDELATALAKLEASTAEIRKLQSGLQTVCAWTKQIKVGEKWMTPDEFLTTQLHLSLTHGISPSAFREMADKAHRAA